MKKFFALFVAIVMALLLASCGTAYGQYAAKGTVELGGAASYSSTTLVTNGTKDTEASTFLQLMPYVNYFIMDNFSVGFAPSVNILNVAHSTNSMKFYGIFAVPGYSFNTSSNVFPFVQGFIGYTSADPGTSTTQSGLSYGGKGGIKVSVGQSGLASFGVSYMIVDISPSGASSRTGFNNLAFSVGYSIFIN